MANRYEPQFCSKKRLAHMALRDAPAPAPPPEPLKDMWTRCMCGRFLFLCTEKNRRCRQSRAQAMLDIRRSRGEAMEASLTRWGRNGTRRLYGTVLP